MSISSETRKALLVECVTSVLRPIVRLMLSCGLNCMEFVEIVRIAYVRVATETYGIRGRPTNISRVSALTGLTRRRVKEIREHLPTGNWSPDIADNPLNTLIHYWRYDDRFGSSAGEPRVLPLTGDGGFEELVRVSGSGVPISTLRKEMLRQGIATMRGTNGIQLIKHHAYPTTLDDDFLRNWAFSLSALGSTLAHNAAVVSKENTTDLTHIREGRFEQIAWSRRLSDSDLRSFQIWSRQFGHEFVQTADRWIARHEDPTPSAELKSSPTAGIGVYFFVDPPKDQDAG